MSHFLIQGLYNKSLRGQISIHGAKNAVLKAMASSVLFDGPVTLANVPMNSDVKTLSDIMVNIGSQIDYHERGLTIDTGKISHTSLDAALAKTMRASIVLTGPLLARFGKVVFPDPGGCVIGARPIDLFLNGYEAMGAIVDYHDNSYHIYAPQGLRGAEIFFPFQTVGGTETLMLAAILAKGRTTLKNCALEPEISHLAQYLVSCGANIQGIGTTDMIIDGGALLKANNSYTTIPDRIETGSFMFLGAMFADELSIVDTDPTLVECITLLLRQSGVNIQTDSNSINIFGREKSLKGFNIRSHEYPGFPTDLVAPAAAYLTQVEKGDTPYQILETIYEDRFKYVEDMRAYGANIDTLNRREICIWGGDTLIAPERPVQALDIRAGFAMVMIALCAKGQTRLENIKFIDRGYENLEIVLTSIGVDIKRLD